MPESQDAKIVLYYTPRTRAFTALWLLEELGVDYRLDVVDLYSGRQKQADYLARNPMGKVPTVVDGDTPVSETGAIAIYLADKYTEAGLAPALDAPTRAAYLRWVFFATAIIEPAYAQKFMGWEAQSSTMAWGSFDQMLEVLRSGVEGDAWLTGEQFTAADVLVGSAVRFGHMFSAFPREGVTAAYEARVTDRDAFRRAAAIEAREGERLPPTS